MNSSTGMKVAAAVMAVVAVGLGVLVANSYRQSTAEAEAARAEASAQQAQVPQTLAVVAVKPLAAYQAIPREAVSLVPVSVAPTRYFTNLDEVVGRIPLVDVDAGAPVTPRYFSEGNALARIIPEGHQAISMEVNDVISVGGFVRPGDIVDLLLYLRGGVGVDAAQSRILLKQVRVLAYEDRIIDRPEGLTDAAEGSADARRRVRTAVLAVPERDTTRVMLGMSLGELRLSLHGQRAASGEVTPTAETGLPLTAAAVADIRDREVPDQVISIAELARIKPPPAVAKARPSRPSVEIIRGAEITRVTP
ncbi:Flp pilus assembly protein CpaB [Flagellatimonas centrodinii]|uniref:Flp pilus assembly protein CpaB n=1 Tax=Flagellatimonas centrodinii TaxID=2806210 RepID=UPI001FEE5018|nr:Flp pilus assembly protein CpaB [Flagellatimonas centrodinii]ULQ45349.1 Flp pilus assembly protein CpaB [Flagellatimonas centrodinii]